jgi:glycosyltransferase involved in cell wall biosynthesis
MIQATVIVPTFDHGPTLRYSVGSALTQTVADVEVFIVGDGVPAGAREVIAELLRLDPRVRFFDHPKHSSRGEPYRHAALAEARGRVVCYLADDDLYLPNHVETMLSLLADADFAHAFPLRVEADGTLGFWPVNLALPEYRRHLLHVENRIPTTAAAHTLEVYRRLERGWEAPPAGVPTDLHMWRKFLAQPAARFIGSYVPTVLVFPSPFRNGWSIAERVAELERWTVRLRKDGELARELMPAMIKEAVEKDSLYLETHRALVDTRQALAKTSDCAQSPDSRLRRARPDK